MTRAARSGLRESQGAGIPNGMPKSPIAIAILLLASGCQPAEVQGELRSDCGPLDGPALTVILPDGEDTIRLYAEGAPETADGDYTVDDSPHVATEIGKCSESDESCVYATDGGFTIERQADGMISGTFAARFTDGSNRELNFSARPVDDPEPVLCG